MRRVSWLVAACAAAHVLAAQGTQPGVVVENTSTENGVRISGAPLYYAGHTTRWVVGERSRIDGVWHGAPLQPQDAYSIRRDSGAESLVVIPSTRTVRVQNSVVSEAVARSKGHLMNITRYDVTALGAGERILGHATQRYRMVRRRDVTQGLGMPTTRMSEETTIWLAMDQTDPVIAAAMRHTALAPNLKERPRGIVLRSTTVIRNAAGGPSMESSSIATRLALVAIDTMKFVPPAGYKRVGQEDLRRERSAHVDSLFRSQRAKDRTAEAHQRAWLDSNGVRIQTGTRKP